MSASQSVSKGDQQHQWFGHPAGLATLFFTEMWERFSYYGMRAILILFMTSPIAIGGLGWPAEKAGPLYGLYTALVYLTALPGGWIADRFIGQRRAVMTGAIIIMFGHISLMFHGLSAFYAGLFLIVVGTGFLKPNISALVGGLYKAGEEDAKRDAGFSIFYMGINLGAFASPLVCGFLAQDPAFQTFLSGHGMDPANSWHWGFGAAAVGMFLGIIQYALDVSKFGVIFRSAAVGLMVAFFIFMIYLKGGGDSIAANGVMAQASTPLVQMGIFIACAAVVIHVLWLVGFIIANSKMRKFLGFAAVASLVVLVGILVVSGPGGDSAVESIAEAAVPTNTILLISLIVAVLINAGLGIRLLMKGQKLYGIFGFVLSLGLWYADFHHLAADASGMQIFVNIFSYVLPTVAYAYFAIQYLDDSWTPTERKRIYAIPVFFVAAAVFWSAFEQAGSSMTLFAQHNTMNSFLGFAYPASWFQSVNAIFIVLLAPVFAWAWTKLDKLGREPSSPMKFGVGLYLLGVGFAVLAFAALVSLKGDGRVGAQWLLSVYLLHTLGELCLSPVGLSTMTKLAPAKLSGQMMGIWFLGAAIGNFIGGIVAGFFESFPLPLLFGAIFGTTLLATIVMLLLVKPMKGLMAGVN